MKINNFRPSGINPYKNQINKLDSYTRETGKKKDVVEISAEAKEMQQISPLEKERQSKVDEIKNRVDSGTYNLHPNEIAKSIIQYYKK